jgi:hypothetical protein
MACCFHEECISYLKDKCMCIQKYILLQISQLTFNGALPDVHTFEVTGVSYGPIKTWIMQYQRHDTNLIIQ